MKELHLTLRIRNNRLLERRTALGLSAVELCKRADINLERYRDYEKLQRDPVQSEVLMECRIPECHNKASRQYSWLCVEHRFESGGREFRLKRHRSEWRPDVIKLAAFYKCEPVDLFPAEVLLIDKSQVKHEKTVDVGEVAQLLVSDHTERLQLGPDEVLEQKELAVVMKEAMKTLPGQLKTAIEERFGLDGRGYTTLKEAAQYVPSVHHDQKGISTERLRQIEQHALCLLRRRIEEME